MSTETYTFTTSNKQLATHLYKQGYTDYTIFEQDGNQCFQFILPIVYKKQMKQIKKKFLNGE